METKVVTNSLHAWCLASRPKTLSAALTPVVTASALAYAQASARIAVIVLCMLFAIFMQIAANFINDYYDFKKGTDGADRLGPERACAQGWITLRAMRWGIGVVLVLACLIGCALLYYGSWYLLLIGGACVIFAFLYTTLLSYCGMGDILVYVFFGVVPVALTYYLQSHTLCAAVWWLSAAIGLSTDTLLVLNNYRDRDTDRKAGKRTLIVALGERFGSLFYLIQGLLAGLCAAVVVGEYAPYAIPFVAVYLVPHIYTWRKMVRISRGKQLNAILGETSKNMLLLGLYITISLLVATY